MHARELRIGNLVYYNGTHEEIGIVSEILKNDINKVSPYKVGINHRLDIYYNIDNIKPIKITEEWLKKLGFEYNYFEGYHCSLNIIKDYYSFTYDIQSETFSINVKIGYKLEFVHQIQNIYFSLTGEELTLKTE